MSEKIEVVREADFEPGDRMQVQSSQGPIAVFNVDGEYLAIAAICLHQGGPLCKGKVQTELKAKITTAGKKIEEYFSDNPVVACPWHGWEYDLRTGDHVGEPSISLPTFDVVVEDGTVYVSV